MMSKEFEKKILAELRALSRNIAQLIQTRKKMGGRDLKKELKVLSELSNVSKSLRQIANDLKALRAGVVSSEWSLGS